MSGSGYSYRVDVPFLTSHIMHLNASALFLNVHTLQSQYPSSEEGLGCRFGLHTETKQKQRDSGRFYSGNGDFTDYVCDKDHR